MKPPLFCLTEWEQAQLALDRADRVEYMTAMTLKAFNRAQEVEILEGWNNRAIRAWDYYREQPFKAWQGHE